MVQLDHVPNHFQGILKIGVAFLRTAYGKKNVHFSWRSTPLPPRTMLRDGGGGGGWWFGGPFRDPRCVGTVRNILILYRPNGPDTKPPPKLGLGGELRV